MVRSGVVEAVHRGSVAVAGRDGTLVAWAGDPERVTFARSSMKPLQAAVSLTLSGEDLPDDELAVMCASHNGEPAHLRAVDALLDRAGLSRSALRTPPGLPIDRESALAAGAPEPALHNCSGKHAGMLLACVRRGFDVATYPDPDHPLQVAVLDAVRAVAGEPTAVGVDGCGVPVHALPLRAMAATFASLATGVGEGFGRVVESMRAEPYLVAGRDRVCTALMQRVDDLVVKVGAEGLVCAGIPSRGLGVAVKVEDGGSRAADPALLRSLRGLGVLDGVGDGELERFARPPVLGGGRPVGSLVAEFDLTAA